MLKIILFILFNYVFGGRVINLNSFRCLLDSHSIQKQLDQLFTFGRFDLTVAAFLFDLVLIAQLRHLFWIHNLSREHIQSHLLLGRILDTSHLTLLVCGSIFDLVQSLGLINIFILDSLENVFCRFQGFQNILST